MRQILIEKMQLSQLVVEPNQASSLRILTTPEQDLGLIGVQSFQWLPIDVNVKTRYQFVNCLQLYKWKKMLS